MIRLKLSPSKIEKFRQYNEGEYSDYITRESVIASISGAEEWTPKAETGTAFHVVMQFGAERYRTEEFFGMVPGSFSIDPSPKIGESPVDGLVDEKDRVYRVQEGDMPSALEFRYSDIRLADLYHKANPGLVWETWFTWTYILDGRYEIRMTMRFDAMIGNILKEHKTTSRPDADYEFFQRSCQWRIYLMASGAERVAYERFLLKQYDGVLKEVVHNSFNFFPYAEMEQYVANNIRGLIQFCMTNADKEGKNLMEYIKI